MVNIYDTTKFLWQIFFVSCLLEFFRRLVVWSREFGDIYLLWLGTRPLVFVYRAEAVQPLLSSNIHIDKSLEYQYLKPWLGTGLVTSTGQFFISFKLFSLCQSSVAMKSFTLIRSDGSYWFTTCHFYRSILFISYVIYNNFAFYWLIAILFFQYYFIINFWSSV